MKITKKMIDVAEAKGACSEAVRWLRKEPRTTEQLVAHSMPWAEWAINRMCSETARKDCCAAVASARNAYNAATAPARKDYDDAVASARKDCCAAVASARKDYCATAASAWATRDAAVASARKDYDDAVASARKTYGDAVAPALLAALESLKRLNQTTPVKLIKHRPRRRPE